MELSRSQRELGWKSTSKDHVQYLFSLGLRLVEWSHSTDVLKSSNSEVAAAKQTHTRDAAKFSLCCCFVPMNNNVRDTFRMV